MPKLTKALIRQELVNRGFDGFDPADLDRYINYGYFYLARKLRLTGVMEEVTFSLSSGQYSVDLTSLSPVPKSVRKVVVTTAGQQQELTPMDSKTFWETWAPYGFATSGATIDSNHVATMPSWYFVNDGMLIVAPAPSTTVNFLVFAWQSVAELANDNDTYALPEDYEELLLFSAMRVCHVRANELDRANALKADIEEQIRDLLTEDAFVMEELQTQVEPDDSWFAWPR